MYLSSSVLLHWHLIVEVDKMETFGEKEISFAAIIASLSSPPMAITSSFGASYRGRQAPTPWFGLWS